MVLNIRSLASLATKLLLLSENGIIVGSEASDLIYNPIHFLHDSWGAPLPFNSSPIAGGGEFFGTFLVLFCTF